MSVKYRHIINTFEIMFAEFVHKLKKRLRIVRRQKKPLFSTMKSDITDFDSDSIFISGVGRSGTHFMANLLSQSDRVKAYHMDDIGDTLGDSFQWYAKWYDLPVSEEGFIASRKYLIQKELEDDRLYIESNPMIALSIKSLYKQLNSKFIIMVRDPKSVVESHFRKGWYRDLQIKDSSKVPGFQYQLHKPNHSFSRVIPDTTAERQVWMNMTTLGKISWMWKTTYERIFDQISQLDPESFRIIHLDRFNYQAYVDVCEFLSINKVAEETFQKTVDKKPGKGNSQEKIDWKGMSHSEYLSQVSPVVVEFKKYGIDLELN